jgi:hypothetical protein
MKWSVALSLSLSLFLSLARFAFEEIEGNISEFKTSAFRLNIASVTTGQYIYIGTCMYVHGI